MLARSRSLGCRAPVALPRRWLCTTHFGFRTVPEADKERLVGHVFDNVAASYDLMNDVMSAGVHRVWKDMFVDMIGIRRMGPCHLQVLDVAGGTGDIAFRIAEQLSAVERPAPRAEGAAGVDGEEAGARVVVCDINKKMLEEGRRRAATMSYSGANPPRCEWVAADAQQLPFDDCSFDVYTIAFGIRNVTRIDEALREARRVLRPGGRLLVLEFSQVVNPVLRKAYERYSFDVIPRLGGIVADDRDSYQYLVESIQRFPNQEAFSQMIRDAGLCSVNYTNLTNGVVAIHSAVKLS